MALIGDMQYLTIGSKTYRIASSSLPIASASTLGGIKVGTGLTIDSTTGVLNATGTSITIDNTLSSSSTNPVQNKVIKQALDSKANSSNIPTKVSDLINDSGFITSDSDTKNTAGSTNTNSKIFLIGATTQGDNPQTYSQDTAYVGTDGKLYSNGHVVLTGGSNAASAVTITPATTDVYSMTSAGSVTAGSANVPTALDTSKFSGGSFTSGSFSQGTLPTLTLAQDSTDTSQLNITFTQGTLPTHALDSFTGAAIQTGFYTPGVAGTPTAVTLPGRSSTAIKAWTGYTAATADAQTFTGSTN